MVLAIGLASPAAAHNPPGGPFADLQATLAEIQMQIENLQNDMTMLKNTVGNLPTEIDLRGVTQNWISSWTLPTAKPTAVTQNASRVCWGHGRARQRDGAGVGTVT